MPTPLKHVIVSVVAAAALATSAGLAAAQSSTSDVSGAERLVKSELAKGSSIGAIVQVLFKQGAMPGVAAVALSGNASPEIIVTELIRGGTAPGVATGAVLQAQGCSVASQVARAAEIASSGAIGAVAEISDAKSKVCSSSQTASTPDGGKDNLNTSAPGENAKGGGVPSMLPLGWNSPSFIISSGGGGGRAAASPN